MAGTYYVSVENANYACKARGLFRLKGIKPLVGDRVVIEPDQFAADEGVIVDVLKRRSELLRPPVANVDQAIIVVATAKPKPNIHLLDKMLLSCEIATVKPLIVVNKADLVSEQAAQQLLDIYADSGYQLILTSALLASQIEQLSELLKDHISVLAGVSGVGKSSLLNAVIPNLALKTGAVSQKIKRGKHTTRHSELIRLPRGGYVLDTPGFSSLDIRGITAHRLAQYFPDIARHAGDCRFDDCLHLAEPDCAVRAALATGQLHASRYKSYQLILNQLEKR